MRASTTKLAAMRNWLGIALLLALGGCNEEGGKSNPDQAGVGGASGAAGAPGAAGAAAGSGGQSGAAGASGASGAAALPEMLHFEGTAMGSSSEDPGDRVECQFYGDLVEPVYQPNGDVTGVVIGEVFRTIFVDGERASEFSALIGGDGTLHDLGDGAIEARLVGDQPTDAKAFWLELEVLTAQQTAPYSHEGSWQCAPILLGEEGFTDIDVTGTGSWEIAPAPAP
jgi:hypothetical protein